MFLVRHRALILEYQVNVSCGIILVISLGFVCEEMFDCDNMRCFLLACCHSDLATFPTLCKTNPPIKKWSMCPNVDF